MRTQVHVVQKDDNQWHVVVDGKDESVHSADTQEAATEFARTYAQDNEMELAIHATTGEIRKKDSSGEGVDDPNAPDHT